MFIQFHMLQSMPPGNLNRDETGQPKKCVFGGVTRARVSSQCLKRNIRLSRQFREAFGGALADRTTSLPRMVADELTKDQQLGITTDEIPDVTAAIAAKFKKEKRAAEIDETDDQNGQQEETADQGAVEGGPGQTGQLVFFPPPFARRIAVLAGTLCKEHRRAFEGFIGRKLKPKLTAEEETEVKRFVEEVAKASKELTVDIGLFGRMTTSDLVVNVEASCQVAHAISTHETIIEGDYFTAMDDRADKAGAAYIGTDENVTYYNAAVYYKYLNLDLDALRQHLGSLTDEDAAKVAGVLLNAAALSNPTGKQNSFANHGIPQLILVELSKVKRPISYANAFLQPVDGPGYLAQSAVALKTYVESVATAFQPVDMKRFLLAKGDAAIEISAATPSDTLADLTQAVEGHIAPDADLQKGQATP